MSKPKLRVLFIGISLPAETFLNLLVRGLAEAGVEVTIASPSKPNTEWFSSQMVRWIRTSPWEGLILRRCLHLGWRTLRAAVSSPRDVQLLLAHIRKTCTKTEGLRKWNRVLPLVGRRWDVVYFPWNAGAIDYSPIFALGCPTVVSCRGSQINVGPQNPKRSMLRDGLALSFKEAAAVHCVSEDIKEKAIRYGLDPLKAHVIPAAVDENFFQPFPNPRTGCETLRVISVGRLVWVKGYEDALRSIRCLLDKRVIVRFDIVGDGPEYQRLLYTIRDLRLEGIVHLHGGLRPFQIRELLQKSDVFLLSSLSEGFCNAILEAKACGLPVVTTDCGGTREAVVDGQDGFVVPVRSAVQMAEALFQLAVNPALRRKMGDEARQSVLHHFTIDNQVKSFISLFESVKNSNKSLSPVLSQ